MDRDENDLLSTNVFIPKPELVNDVPTDGIDEFKNFYLRNLELENQAKIIDDIKNVKIGEDAEAQDNDLLNTNAVNFSIKGSEPNNQLRKTKEVKTYVNIDSRDRDKVLYKNANQFKIFLSKTFYNVKSIRLSSIEFPNTDAIINDRNKYIYWRNQEDIDEDITISENNKKTYPIYSTALRVGRYTASSLQTEIISKMNKVRRKDGAGDFHYFVVTLDLYTDIVTFISLKLIDLVTNPFTTVLGSNIITVTTNEPHNYKGGELVYIVGSPSIGGIPATSINGFRSVILISNQDTKFNFEININASETGRGGGSNIKIGNQGPFQLLWGGHITPLNTFAQNLGFPLEDSSKRIYTNINKLKNIYQMNITTTAPHLLTNQDINSVLEIGSNISGNFINSSFTGRSIISIPTINTILVEVEDDEMTREIIKDFNKINSTTTQIRFSEDDNRVLDVVSYNIYDNRSFILTTNVDHRYDLGDVGKSINLYNTQNLNDYDDTSNYDGVYKILQRLNSTQLILPGSIIEGEKVDIGYIPRHQTFTTWTVPISNITSSNISGYSTIICTIDHNLVKGDTIRLINVNTSPILPRNNIFTITHVTNQTFDIEKSFTSSSVDNSSIVSTGLITVSFPAHGFNKIIDIDKIDSTTVKIQTLVAHNLNKADEIRIMETNTTESIDGFYEITEIVDDDEFKITVPVSQLIIPDSVNGIIGMSNSFNLYGAEDISNISANILNGTGLNVRDIIDENTFTFYLVNSFANETMSGGGDNIYISSNLHGYSGVQTNTKDGILNRSINLEGENYCFLTCPQLDTMKNTGSVKNIFARISLDQAPGYICFNYLSNPKDFDKVPLNTLGDLEFSCINYDGSLYGFNDLDYSFVLEIIEVIDDSETFNISSRRGIKYI